MTPEDIGDIFQELEDALFAMAIRNMDAHKNWEKAEGFKWTQWQAEQITGLREYREKVNKLTNKGFDKAKKAILKFLKEAYKGSVEDAAGMAVKAGKGNIRPAFFGVNSEKMDIIVNEAIKDIDTKRYACINRMNSGYTDFLRKADIFAQSGSMTIPQALDYAMKDFLSAGLNCVEYSNGNRVNIASYAEMALRTSSSEVTRQANGDVRNELGEYLVVSNVIGMTCPICQEWQGKVMIDDVYSEGKPDGKHKLVSEAKAAGFLHPNCRHQLFMYIEGITEIAELPNDVENKEHYKAEQEQRRQEREIRKYKRLRDGAVDPADRQKYDARVKEWTAKHDQYLTEHPYLRKNPKRLAPGYTGNGKPVLEMTALEQYSKVNLNSLDTKSDTTGIVSTESPKTMGFEKEIIDDDSAAETSTVVTDIENNNSIDSSAGNSDDFDKSIEMDEKEKQIKPEKEKEKPKYIDITESWHDHIPEGEIEVIDRATPVDKDGNDYSVIEQLRKDDKADEHKVAEMLSKVIHSEIEIIPEVDNPKGCPTPDFLIRRTGETMELKTLKKVPPSMKAIYNAAKKAKDQSSFVIVDISIYTHEHYIKQQVKDIFRYDGTAFIDRLMLIRNGEIFGVYKRIY